MEHNSTFPIKQSELDMLRDEATSYIKSIQWEQGERARNKDKDAQDESILLYLSRAKGNGGTELTSVSKTIFARPAKILSAFLKNFTPSGTVETTLEMCSNFSFGYLVSSVSNISSMPEVAEDAAILVNPHDINEIVND